METFWELIIGPLLMLRRPATLLEVGSEEGRTTRLLLGYCRCFGAVLHVIEPVPRYDVQAWKAQFGDRFVLHQGLSLQVLPKLGAFDVVLIDGDHNWHTVYHELKTLEERSAALAQPFPLVLFHDIGWPYGRRDLYYDPGTIPAVERQPFERKGIRRGSNPLQDGGINAHLCNACHEGGPRNGVLTGIEDFLREAKEPLELVQLPGFHGLGILFSKALAEQNPDLGKFLAGLDQQPHLKRYLELQEANRLDITLYLQQYQAALGQRDAQWRTEVERLQRTLQAKNAEIAQLQERLTCAEKALVEGERGNDE